MSEATTVLTAARHVMTTGAVDEAAELLTHLWLTLPVRSAPNDVRRLHNATSELADRFPLAESVSKLLHRATVVYARRDDFAGATVTATRMLGVWRARCQATPTDEALEGHLHALDTVAAVHRAQGRLGPVKACLVELAEWQSGHGTTVGVAWSLRELGAIALLEGDLVDAIGKFTRAGELYGENPEFAEDPEVVAERAECRVLLGRALRARGDDRAAEHWFEEALGALPDGPAAQEVRDLLGAVRSGDELPDPVVLPISAFGQPIWEQSGEPEDGPLRREPSS